MNNTELQVIAEKYFSRIHEISEPLLASVKVKVLEKFLARVCKRLLPLGKVPEDFFIHYELNCCVEDVLTEMWDLLEPDERLEIRFPGCRSSVGKQRDLPNRGTGTIVSVELTRRFGVNTTFLMADGSFYVWEFID